MPVDKQLLSSCIDEAAAGDAEIRTLLLEKFEKNENAAVAFCAGFTRNRDYTQKTAALAGEKKELADKLAAYQTQLEAAETEKAKILKDLANQRVTVAGANARLQSLKEKYQLDDDDIPPMGDLIQTRKTGKVEDSSATDFDEKLAAMKKEIMDNVTKTLVPELGGMTELDIVWSDIADEHRELTGKRLTATERREILKTAQTGGKSLMSVWEEKYAVGDLRKKVEREAIVKEERAKWDAEQQARRDKEALEGVRPGAADQTGLRTSPVLKKEFAERGVEVTPEGQVKTPAAKSAEQRDSLGGAERAAKRFLARRAAGVPMGGKEPVKAA